MDEVKETKKQMDDDYNFQYAHSANYMALTKYWVSVLALRRSQDLINYVELEELLKYNRKKYEEYTYAQV